MSMPKVLSSDDGEIEYRKRIVPSADIFVPEHVLSEMTDHAQEGLEADSEIMGLIIGKVYADDRGKYAVADRISTSALIADRVGVRFDKERIEEMFSSLVFKEGERVIGWYHSHLDIGCFMSPTDVKTQNGLFSGECGFAIVIDPVRQELRVFDSTPDNPQPADMIIMEAD